MGGVGCNQEQGVRPSGQLQSNMSRLLAVKHGAYSSVEGSRRPEGVLCTSGRNYERLHKCCQACHHADEVHEVCHALNALGKASLRAGSKGDQ